MHSKEPSVLKQETTSSKGIARLVAALDAKSRELDFRAGAGACRHLEGDGIAEYEDGMVYFAMLAQLQRRHFPLFGIKDQPFALDEKQRMKIVAKLTDAQKTLIKRDFISHFLCENGHGDNNASKLLRDFANMHFPDQYGLAKATHEEEYQKRHERLEERIKEMKKAEKKAAKEAEKQQTAEKTEKKVAAPKTEKPESGKAA